jgi:hypothetical protein
MTDRPVPAISDEFFVEWQLAPESTSFIDLSAGPGEAPEMVLAEEPDVRTQEVRTQ